MAKKKHKTYTGGYILNTFPDGTAEFTRVYTEHKPNKRPKKKFLDVFERKNTNKGLKQLLEDTYGMSFDDVWEVENNDLDE